MTQNVFAYIVGRRLIEPGLRLATIQRIVLLFVILTPFVLYEWRMTSNPWMNIGTRFFHLDIPVGFSSRNGHVRVQASFSHAILAAMIFCIVFMLSCYLANVYKYDKSRLDSIICKLERFHLPEAFLLVCLWFTQSRGPQISAVVSYSVLQIPKFRHLKLAALLIALVLAIGGSAMFSYYDAYTSAANNGTLSEAQTSAIYRRDLLKNYEPLVEQGGWLGWGSMGFPEAGGQRSIDNAYLIIELAQGKFGFYSFILIMLECLGTTAYNAFTFQSRDSRFLAFVLPGGNDWAVPGSHDCIPGRLGSSVFLAVARLDSIDKGRRYERSKVSVQALIRLVTASRHLRESPIVRSWTDKFSLAIIDCKA